jgi:hypothetical protein
MNALGKGAAVMAPWFAVAVIAYCAPSHVTDAIAPAVWASLFIALFF